MSSSFTVTLPDQPIEKGTAKLADGERALSVIAREIKADWKNVYFGAVPYLQALAKMNSIDDMYGAEEGVFVVLYFLSNATTWRGVKAREIKKELNSMVKAHNKRKGR